MLLNFQVEPFAQAWPEVRELAPAHWREVAIDPDIPLDVSVAGYERMEAAGQLLLVTARLEGEAVGYHASFLGPHPTYSGFTALVVGFYLHPDQRRGRNAFDLFAFVEAEAVKRGVTRMFASFSVRLNLEPFLR